MRHFTDKVAIVTGAASGIGAALGRELAQNGATVILANPAHQSDFYNGAHAPQIAEITGGASDRGIKVPGSTFQGSKV